MSRKKSPDPRFYEDDHTPVSPTDKRFWFPGLIARPGPENPVAAFAARNQRNFLKMQKLFSGIRPAGRPPRSPDTQPPSQISLSMRQRLKPQVSTRIWGSFCGQSGALQVLIDISTKQNRQPQGTLPKTDMGFE